MTAETEETKQLIRDIVASFVEHPETIEVGGDETRSSCYWIIRVHPEDEGKAVGFTGHHVKALAILVEHFGNALGMAYKLKLITVNKAAPREKERRQAHTYDPQPAQDLLYRILSAMELGAFSVNVAEDLTRRPLLAFIYEVRVLLTEDYAKLVGPQLNDRGNVISAIGSLFRARAKKDGVYIQLNVIKP